MLRGEVLGVLECCGRGGEAGKEWRASSWTGGGEVDGGIEAVMVVLKKGSGRENGGMVFVGVNAGQRVLNIKGWAVWSFGPR